MDWVSFEADIRERPARELYVIWKMQGLQTISRETEVRRKREMIIAEARRRQCEFLLDRESAANVEEMIRDYELSEKYS